MFTFSSSHFLSCRLLYFLLFSFLFIPLLALCAASTRQHQNKQQQHQNNTTTSITSELLRTVAPSAANRCGLSQVTGACTFLSLFAFPSLPLRTAASLLLPPAALMVPCYYRAVHFAQRME